LSEPLRDEKATPAVAFCFALNRLLGAEAWAREKLAPFAGEVVELRAPPLPRLRLTIVEGGRVAPGGEDPAVVLTFNLGSIDASGNERLAAEVMHLVRHLRWDFEEDLARLVGDVAAHRIAGALRDLAGAHLDAARRLGAALADYAAEEQPLLVRRDRLAAFAAEVARLGDGVERLGKRIERLG
jgi:ubiquinone biosynthesis accessory factor UbiJ